MVSYRFGIKELYKELEDRDKVVDEEEAAAEAMKVNGASCTCTALQVPNFNGLQLGSRLDHLH